MLILNGILPVFIIIGLGYFLKKKKIMDDSIENFINNLAYYLILPCMIFSSIYDAHLINIIGYIKIITGLYIVIALTFFLSLFIFKNQDEKKKRSLVTTSFRTNIAYIGFPIILNFYGQNGLAEIAIITGFIAPFTIILSNAYLSLTSSKKISNENWSSVILKDPLVVTSIIALIFSYYKIWLPKFLLNTINLLSDMGSPLMLLAVGAGLKIIVIKNDKFILAMSSIIKLIIMPFFSFLIFRYLIIIKNSTDFGIAVLTLAFSTALASYVVVKKYDADAEICAAAITFSTVVSIFTISLWTYLLISVIK